MFFLDGALCYASHTHTHTHTHTHIRTGVGLYALHGLLSCGQFETNTITSIAA